MDIGEFYLAATNACDVVFRRSKINIESVTPRILVLELEGNPKTTVVCVHSPHNSSTEEDIEDFYESLRQTVGQVPPHNFR